MSGKKKMTMDLVFWFLVINAVVFGVSQFVRMLSSTQGVSTSAYLFTWVSVSLNAYLAFKSHKAKPSRTTLQTAGVQLLGVIIYCSFIVLVIVKGSNVWDWRDSLTSGLVVVGCVFTLIVAKKKKFGWKDPIVKGLLSLFAKAMPQVIMAYKVWQVGGKGLSGVMIVTFHILTITRIIQILITVNEFGIDRNRRGLLISEIGNELSWALVTIAWLLT